MKVLEYRMRRADPAGRFKRCGGFQKLSEEYHERVLLATK
jgi:hypothetical protein